MLAVVAIIIRTDRILHDHRVVPFMCEVTTEKMELTLIRITELARILLSTTIGVRRGMLIRIRVRRGRWSREDDQKSNTRKNGI